MAKTIKCTGDIFKAKRCVGAGSFKFRRCYNCSSCFNCCIPSEFTFSWSTDTYLDPLFSVFASGSVTVKEDPHISGRYDSGPIGPPVGTCRALAFPSLNWSPGIVVAIDCGTGAVQVIFYYLDSSTPVLYCVGGRAAMIPTDGSACCTFSATKEFLGSTDDCYLLADGTTQASTGNVTFTLDFSSAKCCTNDGACIKGPANCANGTCTESP